MGARTQVKIVDLNNEAVYLYAHWGAGGRTIQNVQDALRRRVRWNDSEYLSRIIFSEMIKHDIEGEIGYGIGLRMHGDIEELIVVNIKTQTVHISRAWSIEELEKLDRGILFGANNMSFSEFVSSYDISSEF